MLIYICVCVGGGAGLGFNSPTQFMEYLHATYSGYHMMLAAAEDVRSNWLIIPGMFKFGRLSPLFACGGIHPGRVESASPFPLMIFMGS